MGSEIHKPHFFFFPSIHDGHVIPMVDMAKLFASRGVKTTIVTISQKETQVSKAIQSTKSSGFPIQTITLNFQIPEGVFPEEPRNLNPLSSQGSSRPPPFISWFASTTTLQEPLEKLLQEFHPDCLVADVFFYWANDASSKFGIPRLIFHGTSLFSFSVSESLRIYNPQKDVPSDSEPFLVPRIPGNVMLTKNQIAIHDRLDGERWRAIKESELTCYGFVVNSFHELEPDYYDYLKNVMGKRVWVVGPVSLCNKQIHEKEQRGNEASIDGSYCLKWLDSRKPNSVLYICFGSGTVFSDSQLKEIAIGIENSGQDFIWVVRKEKKPEEAEEGDWLPEGFEKRMEGKGLIIRGWAPQMLILEHEAVGGFVTHCGWNSTLEGITTGKPMVTWPVSAEQFYNEKLVTQVLRIGVSVGAQKMLRSYGDEDIIKNEIVEKAVTRIMVGEKAEEMRGRVKSLGEMARMAIEEGGSSFSNLNLMIQEFGRFHV